MGNEIKDELEKVERKENITIILACESGSRAWGFPSPDSDYDVRFIYIKPLNWYLSIENQKDFIELPVYGNMDISGWNIRKALKLLHNSNAVIFEWLQSPIIYKSFPGFKEELFKISSDFFSPKASMLHYLGLSKKSLLSNREGDKIKIKQYFYILRPLLAAMWIAKYNRIPPMEFNKLLKLIETGKSLFKKIKVLLKENENALEKDKIPVDPEIQDFIEIESEKCRATADDFVHRKKDPEKLNIFFRNTLKKIEKKQ